MMARYRRQSYVSSRYASDRDTPAYWRAARHFENTYRLQPSVDQRFQACYAQPIIAQVLQVRRITDEILFKPIVLLYKK